MKSCAKFTAKSASETTVRHLGETIGTGVATAGCAIAAGVTFGQVDGVNQAVVSCANATGNAGCNLGNNIVTVGDGILSGTPGVGHIKGGIHYLCGDTEGGDACMKAASRTTGVIGGVVGGALVGGPPGAVIGGVAAGAASDGVITGVESGIKGEFKPYG